MTSIIDSVLLTYIHVVVMATASSDVRNKTITAKIGALFGQNFASTTSYYDVMEAAITYVNQRNILTDVELTLVTSPPDLKELDKFSNIKAACSMIEQGAIAVIGPSPSTVVIASHPVCENMQVPQIAPHATDPHLTGPDYGFLIKMLPPDIYQSLALAGLMRYYGWTRMSILVEDTDYGRHGLETFVRVALDSSWDIAKSEVFSVSARPQDIDARTQLKSIKNSGARVVILNTLYDFAMPILAQAKELDMFDSDWAWIVTDGVTDGGQIVGRISIQLALYPQGGRRVSVAQFPGLLGLYPSSQPGDVLQEIELIMRRPLAISEMTLVDAILTLAYGIDSFQRSGHVLEPPAARPGICSGGTDQQPWAQGQLLLQHMLNVNVPGARSPINFTKEKYIQMLNYDLMNFVAGKWKTVGRWSYEDDRMDIDGEVFFPGLETEVPVHTKLDVAAMTFDVVTILESPFVMLNPGFPTKSDQQYIGFSIQLLQELQTALGFSYNLRLVADGKYGAQNRKTKLWNGLMGDVTQGRADIAVAPLTITSEREEFVDFTAPYLDTGYDVLTHNIEPSAQLFDFLKPFDVLTWIALLIATYTCGFAVCACSFLSPCGYRGRHTQTKEESDQKRYDRDKDVFNIMDSVWFAFSSFLIQGPMNNPISLSGRVVAATWWGITTIILAAYTANLTAFLTVSRLEAGISTVYDLVRRTDLYQYGTVADSAVEEFFSQATLDPLPAMYQFMDTMNTYVNNASEGIAKVKGDAVDPDAHLKYALIFDATTLEYAARQQPCVTQLTGKLFRQQGYGLALTKQSPYTRIFTSAILNLREAGTLEAMYKIWMTGPCSPGERTKVSGRQITVDSLLGLFYLFAGSIVIALLIIIPCEYILMSYKDVMIDKRRKKPKTSVSHHLKRRLNATLSDVRHTICVCRKQEYKFTNHLEAAKPKPSVALVEHSKGETRRMSHIKYPRWSSFRQRHNNFQRRKSSVASNLSAEDSYPGTPGTKTNPVFNMEEHLLYLWRKSNVDLMKTDVGSDTDRNTSSAVDDFDIPQRHQNES